MTGYDELDAPGDPGDLGDLGAPGAPDAPGVEHRFGKVLTVDELCAEIKEVVDSLDSVAVQGEVQSLSKSARGHKYFDLAGEKALVRVKMWASVARNYDFERGDHVVVEGPLDFYPPRGELSLTARRLTLSGQGAILAKIEATRRKLDSEGLFGDERKKPIPMLPQAIGVICGTDAAVRRDLEAARATRFPGFPIVWRESLVSGAAAVEQLIEALGDLDRDPRVDVIILARGGGSFDDLIPFSDERLCRTVASAETAVVSAIGHEADVPLCDLVADLRCSTPTRAGIEVIPSREELMDIADSSMDEADRTLVSRFQLARSRIDSLGAQLETLSPSRVVESFRERLARLSPDLPMHNVRTRAVAACRALGGQLESLGPSAVVGRGYAVVRTGDGAIVVDPGQAPSGAQLELQLAKGKLAAQSQGAIADG